MIITNTKSTCKFQLCHHHFATTKLIFKFKNIVPNQHIKQLSFFPERMKGEFVGHSLIEQRLLWNNQLHSYDGPILLSVWRPEVKAVVEKSSQLKKTIYREEKVVFTYSITNLGFETMLFDILSSSAVYFFAINKMITVSIIRQQNSRNGY